MTESELLTRNPQYIHAPHQHSQQQLQQPSTSLLLNPNVRLERLETFTAQNLINSLETNYHGIVERFGNSPLNETTQYLTNNIIDPKEAKHLIDGFLCAVLVDAQNAEKHFTCLKTLAISTDQWMDLLTSFNILTLEVFPFMKHQCRQQLLYFIDETLKLQLRTNLDSSITNICRALSDGTDFRETCQIVHQFAHRLLSSHQKFSSFPRNSSFPPTAFALFSRFISDAQFVANAGIMNLESFKAPLVEICVILVHERFADLLQLGHDLFLLLLRLSRVSQFVPIWRTLLHNPSAMAPKFTGLQQLLSIPTSSGLLSHRVSLRISRKMADILKIHIRISSLLNTNPSMTTQLRAELNRQFEALKTMVKHLSGPDSGSIRAEIIRHVWAFTEPKEFNPQSNEARAALLGWLLRTAKNGAELQWCKLVFFWEWFGYDPSLPNAHFAAEPVISTIRHLLNSGHTPLGNSLVDFLIKSTSVLYPPLNFFFINSVTAAMKSLETTACLQVHSVFVHSKLDQILRDQFRSTFPDFFPKRLTSIADNLAAPSSIIDFEAIRKTTTNSLSSCTNLTQKQSNVAENMEQNVLINGRGSNVSISENKPPTQIKMEPSVEAGGNVVEASRSLKNVLETSKMEKEGKEVGGGTVLRTSSTGGTRRPLTMQTEAPPLKKKMKENDVKIEQEHVKIDKIKEKKKEERQKIKKIEAINNANKLPSYGGETVKASKSDDSLQLTIADDEEEEETEKEEEKDDEEEQQSTSKRLPLTSLLPMVREEFREHLEALFKAMKKKQNQSDEEAITSMQNLMDSIFDANEMECDQTEYIALCLLRIFDSYLEQKQSYLSCEEPSEDEISELMEQPLYRFFKTLCRSGEETDTRRFLLSILRKMIEECQRVGYFIERENHSLSRGNGWPTVDQAVGTYKAVCEVLDVEWERQLAKDLEHCSFDDYQLFSHLLVNVLARLTPFGPPTKVMRLICGSMNTRLLSRLMSEIVRENVVLFGEETVLSMLIDSLKWDSLEQIMLWQMLQTEAVEFDKQRLNYNQHPEATAAVIVIMRNMEPDPNIAVMKSLMRNLLLRPPNKDLFTVDAIKLLIDYEDNIPPVANCIGKFMKKAISDGDIRAPSCSPGHSSFSKMKNRVLTAENIFGHLDRLRKYCFEKESHRAENLMKNQLILDMALSVKRNPKTLELRSKFDELFALFDILLDTEQISNVHGGKQQRRKATKKNDGSPTKRKFRGNKLSESDDD
uniref:SOSS complex subunit A homolog n=1 Tax=Meloidogyne hapla TaxID=6305 RepID=A0A1I8BL51_MELHA